MGFPGVLLVVLLAASTPRPDLLPGEEHLPLRTKPPAPAQLPTAMPPYAERLGTSPRSDGDRVFDRLADGLLAHELESAPIVATELGVHDYDAIMPATDRIGIGHERALCTEFHARIARLDSAALEPRRRAERARLLSLLERKSNEGRWWETDPQRSIAIVSDGLNSILGGDFAPIEARGWNAVARLTAVPGVLKNARAQLDHPARADVEAAIPAARELVAYLSSGMPVQMAAVRDPVLREEFDHHLAQAAGAAADFHGWLGAVLLPRAGAGQPQAPTRKLDREIIESLLEPRGEP